MLVCVVYTYLKVDNIYHGLAYNFLSAVNPEHHYSAFLHRASQKPQNAPYRIHVCFNFLNQPIHLLALVPI